MLSTSVLAAAIAFAASAQASALPRLSRPVIFLQREEARGLDFDAVDEETWGKVASAFRLRGEEIQAFHEDVASYLGDPL